MSLGSVESEKMRSRKAVVDGGDSDDDSSERRKDAAVASHVLAPVPDASGRVK